MLAARRANPNLASFAAARLGSGHDTGEVAAKFAGAEQKILNLADQFNERRRFSIVAS